MGKDPLKEGGYVMIIVKSLCGEKRGGRDWGDFLLRMLEGNLGGVFSSF